MNRFTVFLAGNNYEVQGDLDLYFQNTMSIMLKMSSHYIIELKRDLDPATALKQIKEKGYDKPFLILVIPRRSAE